MKGASLAQVRHLVVANDGRSLIHAVDADGLEIKIEVPDELVRGLSTGPERVLLFAWSLHELPEVKPVAAGEDRSTPAQQAPTEAPAEAPAAPSARAVEEEFMTLFSRMTESPPRGPDHEPRRGGPLEQLFGLMKPGT
ncbi:MAG: hypothetical protein IPK80_28570 [Nannocystis sp.]|nr:hypothetical protein [Nannocystis sp.]